MCGRYTIRRTNLLVEVFDARPDEFYQELSRPRYNVAPSQPVPIVRLDPGGKRVLTVARWGFIPSWSKELPKVQPINARAETVSTSGMFRQTFARRRCLVPADGFYEWRRLDAKTKQPMFVHFADDRVFALAGMWESWQPADSDEPLETCTIITTRPNRLMSEIHDRMPVILRPEDYPRWLDQRTNAEDVHALLSPWPDGDMQAYPVSRQVNNPRFDDPACVQPVESV